LTFVLFVPFVVDVSSMATTAIQLIHRLRRAWPSSPILDKEMRVSSRRRSNYLLRSAYLAMLTLFVGLIWMDATSGLSNATPSYVAAHMPEAGQTIVVGILWFQFIAAQVVALFMLGSAIPAEIVRGTMATLACTPLSTFQIVLGKLLSKLLQVVLLLAMSLPLLAIVRVFGGVPWGTVIAGLAVTLCSTFFVGAYSLMLSIRSRSLLLIVVITTLLYSLVFGLGGYLSSLGPIVCMINVSQGMDSLLSSVDPKGLIVGMNCVGMVGVALLFLHTAARKLREDIALPRVAGGRGRTARDPPPARRPVPGYLPWPGQGPPPLPLAAPNRPLAVRGPALIWKDLRTFLPNTRGGVVVGAVLAVLILLASYVPMLSPQHADLVLVHWFFVYLYLGFGGFITILASSTALTVEKESRALPHHHTPPH
jgi:ABC-type transport system involved in cytochrome c biogenesis permease component